MHMKYELKHGTISLKTFKEVVNRNWLNMAKENDYESDAVRKFFDLNRWKLKKNIIIYRTKLGD